MPDPNDLTMEEKAHAKRYAKQADAQWAKVAAGKLEGVAPPKPTKSQEQFKHGQTVWHKDHGLAYKVVFHAPDNWLWLTEEIRPDIASRCGGDNYTATDPKRPVHKFKVGDAVLLPGVVVEVDDTDVELPYKVKFGEITGPGEDYDYVWFTEAYLVEGIPGGTP